MDSADAGADIDYLQSIERLAHVVVEEAAQEGWLAFMIDKEVGRTRLQRSINALARELRIVHFDGDGCLGHE
ncbi:hypothetical protein ABIH81_15525 [Micromonospora sp. HUAS YX12]|uniref:Uncharacterized protein n=1 Tax=Micromonospora sp. HUAS YX12 TaxID=3156396 RepID=A0AAU7R8N5_9ACTN